MARRVLTKAEDPRGAAEKGASLSIDLLDALFAKVRSDLYGFVERFHRLPEGLF